MYLFLGKRRVVSVGLRCIDSFLYSNWVIGGLGLVLRKVLGR